VWSVIEGQSTGSTATSRNRWKEERFAEWETALPPLDEQRRIVDLIAAVDEAIEAADRMREYAASSRVSLTEDWFATTNFPRAKLGDVGTVLQGSALPKEIQGQQTGPIPWFKIADMTGHGNVYGYTTAETLVGAETLARTHGKLLPVGTVVFPRVGAAVLTEKKRMLLVAGACDENHLGVTPSHALVPGYTLAYFENLHLASLVQTGAVPSLNQALIRQLPIPVPPIAEQEMLADVTAGLRESEHKVAQFGGALRVLRSALIADLLSGEHEIPASYDSLLSA
jgi:type I restriction enzyme S subunit